jgi:Winged helix DNA-binding domain
MPVVDGDALARERTFRQQIADPRYTSPAEAVRHLGAVQAQDYLGSLWSVGLRVRSAVESDVEDAIAARTIVRTWPMRGTLHFVPAEDVRWMLPLLTPRVLARNAARYRELELDGATFRRSREILVRALRGGRRLTRPQAYAALERGRLSAAGQRGLHILSYLAQTEILCLGPREGRQPTVVLLEEWLPASRTPSRDEAVALLAGRYFAGHGPATLQDFVWWSGLKVRDAIAAIEAIASGLQKETRDGRVYWSTGAVPLRRRSPVAVLLPSWDEYLVAYKERSAALGHLSGQDRLVMPFARPLLVVDGRVCGSWKRSLVGHAVRLKVDYWTTIDERQRRAVESAAQRYARFLGRKLVMA